MSFVNQYIKSNDESHAYHSTRRVGDFIYSVGAIGNNQDKAPIYGLVTKTDLDGNLTWERRFRDNEKDRDSFFTKFVGCDNGDIIVLDDSGYSEGYNAPTRIVRISATGAFVWEKEFLPKKGFNITLVNIIRIGTETYLLQRNDENGNYGQDINTFYKIGQTGNVILQKKLESAEGFFQINDMVFDNNKIMFYGGRVIADKSGPNGYLTTGLVLEISQNLSIANKFLVKDEISVTTGKLSGNSLIIFGRLGGVNASNAGFIGKVPMPAVSGTILMLDLIFTANFYDRAYFNNQFIYLYSGERTTSYVTKLDHNLNFIWNKGFDPGNYIYPGLLNQINANSINILNTPNNGGNGSVPMIGQVDLDLNSCLTTEGTNFSKSPKAYTVSLEVNAVFTQVDDAVTTNPYASADVFSKKNEVCPTVPDDPCVKDNNLCQLYAQIYEVVSGCSLVTPDWDNQKLDYKKLSLCENQILTQVEAFIKAFPEYKLGEVISKQLEIIKMFLDKLDFQSYVNSWDAIQSILDYLSQTGNCECNNTVGITEFTSLQSSHFYLQAAGSKGIDSIKGTLLRWAMKGKLANHLPKGNYANTAFNFNKPDDFVKIYRAPYVTYTATVDFGVAPNTVNDSAHYWIYVVNGAALLNGAQQQYMFYVYFRDSAQYTIARQSYNPATQSVEFIKKYGESLIEIENKTELSFAVSPRFDVESGDNSVMIELLSVEENKVTSPKAASFRKKLDANELNQMQLLSENIRSVRFISTNAFVSKVDFELYSDFINVTSVANGWTFLGKHALTTDSNLAFHRLEPESNCLEKWLRYNDEAYVNADNYRVKWNGVNTEDGFRIIDTVQDYITLSNAADNPEANQQVLVDGEPVGSEEFMISNLHLLQLGSLDYHVARMIGLGILDLDPSIEDNRFMYLASYTTTADLQDGLGARKVEHMYTSLPTGVSDARMPLPVNLTMPEPGVISSHDIETEPILTDEDGYSQDGHTRFLTLFNEDLPEEVLNAPFYYHDFEFSSAETTIPVYAGLEYRKTAEQGQPALPWVKPELTYDRNFYNLDDTVDDAFKNETKSILIPESGFPLFMHRERQNGLHDYSSYGINWFSRAQSSAVIWTIKTTLRPSNTLLPPTNINATLIQPENPLLLTSATEQQMLTQITGDDKTLVRLTFEYNHGQELIDYHKAIDGEIVSGYQQLPANEELFAEDIEVFFRDGVPNSVSGLVLDVDATDPLLAIITTAPFPIVSAGQNTSGGWNESIIPQLDPGLVSNFIGGVLSIDGNGYIIHQIELSGAYPEFTVFKRDISGNLVDNINAPIPSDGLLAPEEGGLFIAVENMLNQNSWNQPAQLIKVNIDLTTVYDEEVLIYNQDGSNETRFQRFRGIYRNATIEKLYENIPDPAGTDANLDGEVDIISAHRGLYKVTFPGYALPQHSQYNPTGNFSVEWYNGVIRIHTFGHPNEPRKELKVYKVENVAGVLTLLVSDMSFPTNANDIPGYTGKLMADNVNTLANQLVNFYPGYKTYLRKNIPYGLIDENIMPEDEDGTKYSVFGLRSHDLQMNFVSKISIPTLMFARRLVLPMKPKEPLGGKFATRPDFYGKASYTFTNEYNHKPHSVQFNRASDIQILSAIYKATTLEHVMNDIFKDGQELFYINRWNNLLGFAYPDGLFEKFPDAAGVALPLPDNQVFIDSINAFIADHNHYYNDNISPITAITNLNFSVIPQVSFNGTIRNLELKIVDFMKDIIFNCFVPLTEIPVVFDLINLEPYVPINKKQVIRDRDGYLLKPGDPALEIAPMAVRSFNGVTHKTQFTDFGLDGASKAKYFYSVREINIQLQTGEYSKINGPVSLVNTAPPTAPEIIKIIPVLEDRTLDIKPAIQIQINAYAAVQNIKKINVFRAFNAVDALSVRTMQLIRIIDVDLAGLTADSKWIVEDDFVDLTEVPFGDPLYYKITVSREIKYWDKYNELQVDFALSEPTKVVITNIAENYSPEAPVMSYTSEPLTAAGELHFVVLSWNKTAYKAKYRVYKLNAQGVWNEIATVASNAQTIYLPLEDTLLGSSTLSTKDADGNTLYHHFKVVAENTAGMFSQGENILSIYDPSTWNDNGGIGDMVVGGTFIVRPN